MKCLSNGCPESQEQMSPVLEKGLLMECNVENSAFKNELQFVLPQVIGSHIKDFLFPRK